MPGMGKSLEQILVALKGWTFDTDPAKFTFCDSGDLGQHHLTGPRVSRMWSGLGWTWGGKINM